MELMEKCLKLSDVVDRVCEYCGLWGSRWLFVVSPPVGGFSVQVIDAMEGSAL